MKNHVSWQIAASAGPPTSLGELRQHVLLPLVGNPLFSDAEQLRANHFVHESDDISRLTRWGVNVLAEIARRQAEAARQRCTLAMGNALRQLNPANFRCHYARPRLPMPSWVSGAFFPSLDQANRRAGTFDRLAAACFLPSDSLTFASLTSRLRR